VPRVHLSFDDGPDPHWTPIVLDLLAIHALHATFFTIGQAARAHPHLLRRMHAAGHALGNHTWSHRHPWTLSSKDARREVLGGAHAIEDATGAAARLFRPPHGRRRACMEAAAAEAGQRVVRWTLSAIDWGPLAQPAGIARRLARARDGDILLMHDAARGINRPDRLLEALPRFLDRLREADWQVEPLGRDDGSRLSPG